MVFDDFRSKDGYRFGFRRSFTGSLVLQVEEPQGHMRDLNSSGYYDAWTTLVLRDARLSDLPTPFPLR